jgi:hypothetical protein
VSWELVPRRGLADDEYDQLDRYDDGRDDNDPCIDDDRFDHDGDDRDHHDGDYHDHHDRARDHHHDNRPDDDGGHDYYSGGDHYGDQHQ